MSRPSPVRQVPCPRCRAPSGAPCFERGPLGVARHRGPHAERTAASKGRLRLLPGAVVRFTADDAQARGLSEGQRAQLTGRVVAVEGARAWVVWTHAPGRPAQFHLDALELVEQGNPLTARETQLALLHASKRLEAGEAEPQAARAAAQLGRARALAHVPMALGTAQRDVDPVTAARALGLHDEAVRSVRKRGVGQQDNPLTPAEADRVLGWSGVELARSRAPALLPATRAWHAGHADGYAGAVEAFGPAKRTKAAQLLALEAAQEIAAAASTRHPPKRGNPLLAIVNAPQPSRRTSATAAPRPGQSPAELLAQADAAVDGARTWNEYADAYMAREQLREQLRRQAPKRSNPLLAIVNPPDDRGFVRTASVADAARACGAEAVRATSDAVQQFHGRAALGALVYRYDDGQPGLRRVVVAALGRVPEMRYVAPFRQSTKAGPLWVHKTRGKGPLLVLDPATGLTHQLGGATHVGRWLFD